MKNEPYYILPTAYFGPVQYYCRFMSDYDIIIEQHDNYPRQTYRNRCNILGANGMIKLSIPVKKTMGRKTKVKDIKLDYDTDWQKDHLRSIVSAYRSSPFYEFYFDDFRWVFNEKTSFLIDLNMKINEIVLSHLSIEKEISLSGEFEIVSHGPDLRDIISPKKTIEDDPGFVPEKYTQVFSERHGFVPNLSVLDLLFNTGPEARQILSSSIRQ